MFLGRIYYFITIVITVTIAVSCGNSPRSNNSILKNVNAQTINKNEDSSSITLIFGGDLMGHGPQIKGAWDDSLNDYNYKRGFQFLKPFIENSDYAIANLEVTLAGPPFTGYPQFSSPSAYARDAKWMGFDALFTANNHSQDRGKSGLINTILTLDSLNIDHTGTFVDSTSFKESYPLIKKIKGIKIAFLNMTYGTNGLTVKPPTMVNMIDTTAIARDINTAKIKGADFIITFIHWGLEYQRTESKNQNMLAQFIADNGCDLIVGMHPHVIQPIKTIKTKDGRDVPVAYSLGNFVSNQRDRYKNGGIIWSIDLSVQKSIVKIENHQYLPFWVHKVLPNEIDSNFNHRGYYLIPPNKKKLLPTSSLNEAELFYSDTRALLSTERELK